MIKFSPLLFVLIIVSCSPSTPKEYDAQKLVDDAISAHGMDLSKSKASFDFREIAYSMNRGENGYTYTRTWRDDSLGQIKDVLINSSRFTRTVNGDTAILDDEWTGKYSRSVNSVLYFFQVPYILNDRGALKSFIGEYEIKDEPYLAVKITFKEDGGGEDFEDVFIYWIHKEFRTVDYFAYNYLTDGGGARFREAINRRTINGMTTQDYINYEVKKGTPLASTPKLFAKGELRELSRIENENVEFTN